MLLLPKNLIYSIVLFLPGLLSAMESTPDTAYFNLRDTFCTSQIILIGNQLFGPDQPSGQVVFPAAAADGSDSIVTVQLTFLQRSETTLTQSLCAGDTLVINGTPYHANFYLGEEIVAGGAANGCDSLIHVALQFYPVVTLFQSTICEGDTIFVHQTAYHAFNTTGEEVIPNGASTGCDSIIRVQLEVLTPPFSEIKDTLCPEEFRIINGRRYDVNNRAGFEILESAASTGCDSLVTLSFSFRQLYLLAGEDQTIAKGDIVCVEPEYGFTPVEVSWSPPPPCDMPDCPVFCFQPLQNTRFQLRATDEYGCVLTDDISINVNSDNKTYAPNVFSPDAEWPNNRFFLSADRGTARIIRMFVADRWGELMYDKSDFLPDDPDLGWDGLFRGSVAPVATYMFYAEMERIDGTTYIKSGTVTLVR
jgi:CHU_C Type IX secretion signal domain